MVVLVKTEQYVHYAALHHHHVGRRAVVVLFNLLLSCKFSLYCGSVYAIFFKQM